MYTMGIDIGGTKIKLGLFDSDYRIIKEQQIATPKENLVEKIIENISDMVRTEKIRGIGVVIAGIVDFDKGTSISSVNIEGWKNDFLVKKLEKNFNLPVTIDNDANGAALAESRIGAARRVNNSICITIGTGIGAGIILNNHLVYGMNGYGGEVGHMTIERNGLVCKCGRKGCWEMYASGKALERKIQENSSLASAGYIPRDLFVKYNKNKHCKKIVDEFIEYLSIGIINLQYIYDSQMIVIGGGVINSADSWWENLLEVIERTSSIPVNLQPAELKSDASMIGASLLITEK